MNEWTGDDLRRWAEEGAKHLDAGRLTMTMDLEHHGVDKDVWVVTMRRTGLGWDQLARERLAGAVADEPR